MSQEWGYIYSATTTSFIRRKWHKIGYTKNIKIREKQLSQGPNMPESFMIHTWFKFKTITDARLVEKRVHEMLDDAGLRVKVGREFFKKRSVFLDVVRDAAEQLNIYTLSNYHLNNIHGFEDMGIFIPCRYFHLNEESVLDNFLHIVGLSYRSFMAFPEITRKTSDLVRNGFPEGIIKPGYGQSLESYLQLHDEESYILSRIINNPVNPLKPWAEEQLSQAQEVLDYYFSYDKDWRQKIKR